VSTDPEVEARLQALEHQRYQEAETRRQAYLRTLPAEQRAVAEAKAESARTRLRLDALERQKANQDATVRYMQQEAAEASESFGESIAWDDPRIEQMGGYANPNEYRRAVRILARRQGRARQTPTTEEEDDDMAKKKQEAQQPSDRPTWGGNKDNWPTWGGNRDEILEMGAANTHRGAKSPSGRLIKTPTTADLQRMSRDELKKHVAKLDKKIPTPRLGSR
jgi:hypothetical protein